MKYRLWPDRLSLQPGNAMVRFQRALLLLSQQNNRDSVATREFWSNWNRWLEMPVEDLPAEQVRDALKGYRLVLKEANHGRALRENHYDFPVESIRGVDAIELLLPEFQEMRSLARILQLEIRLAIAEGRTEDALDLLQTGFRLGEATGQAIDYLIARLVGFAISGIMLAEVENLMLTDGCPNLYWALASLPPTISEVTKSLEFEASIMGRVFHGMEDLPGAGQPAEIWEERAIRILTDLQSLQASGDTTPEARQANSRLLAGLAIVALADYSRNRLLETGVERVVVEAMSPAEAVVRATARSVQVIEDNVVKWTYLPPGMRQDYFNASEQSLQNLAKETQSLGDLSAVMAGLLLPAFQAANSAAVRTEQSIARLVTIEAIRHHVASHGKVPEDLASLTELPAWPDPFTGELFGYEKLTDKSARLTGAPRWSQDSENVTILSFD